MPIANALKWCWRALRFSKVIDISGELKSDDGVGGEIFKVKFKTSVAVNEPTACHIYKADETGLLWCYLPNWTLAGGDEKNVTDLEQYKNLLTILCIRW